jgi:hypothetical protein
VDTVTYGLAFGAFSIDTTKVTSALITIPKVGGSVKLSETEGDPVVEAIYSLDLSSDPDLEPYVLVNGRHRTLKDFDRAPAGSPPCYSTSLFQFSCQMSHGLSNGDVVELRLVHRGTVTPAAYPAIDSAVAKYAAIDDPEKARISAKGSLSYAAERTYSVAIKVKELAVVSRGGGGRPWLLTAGPYVDVAASSDTADRGTQNYGVQAGYSRFDVPGLTSLRAAANSRDESDTKKTVNNFMILDGSVAFGIPGLTSGALPLRGHYHLVPFAGFEVGKTVSKEDTVSRLERRDPKRIKTGATLHLGWAPKLTTLPGPLKAIPFAGVTLDGTATAYHIRRSDSAIAAGKTATPVALSSSATYKLTPTAGLTVGWRNSRLAPLFEGHQVTDLGLSFTY